MSSGNGEGGTSSISISGATLALACILGLCAERLEAGEVGTYVWWEPIRAARFVCSAEERAIDEETARLVAEKQATEDAMRVAEAAVVAAQASGDAKALAAAQKLKEAAEAKACEAALGAAAAKGMPDEMASVAAEERAVDVEMPSPDCAWQPARAAGLDNVQHSQAITAHLQKDDGSSKFSTGAQKVKLCSILIRALVHSLSNAESLAVSGWYANCMSCRLRGAASSARTATTAQVELLNQKQALEHRVGAGFVQHVKWLLWSVSRQRLACAVKDWKHNKTILTMMSAGKRRRVSSSAKGCT